MPTEKYRSCTPWYAQEDLLKAVNMCIDALNRSGITADRAALVPECLEKVIERSNRATLKKATFSGVSLAVQLKNGGYEVTPLELHDY